MKSLLILSTACLVMLSAAQAAVVYSGIRNLTIPVDPDGLYFNVVSGAASATEPGTFNTAPWFNPFFGGEDIGVGNLSQLVFAGVDVLNLGAGTLISGASNFGPAGFGGSAVIGPALGNFQLTTPGLLGIAFKQTVGGSVHYGWVRLVIDNASPGGTVVDWAYDSTPGTSILAGIVPEPSRVVLWIFGCFGMMLHRRR